MKIDPTFQTPGLVQALEAWFAREGRDYPWRRTTDPYAILVSELMLQQTQIATVLDRGYYARWMARFPDVAALAAAGEEEVLRTWEGLGYYRRARFLHQMAQQVMAGHGGIFPRDLKAVRALPGVGDYTLGAVASFAYDERVPLVDGNVARVLSRLWNDPTPVDSPEGTARLWERAALMVAAAQSARICNSALMELGQTHCRSGVPACQSCPVRDYCRADDPAALPVKQKRIVITDVTERVYFQETAEGVLLQQETGSRRTGLWKLPELPPGAPLPPVLLKTRYTITRYKVTLWVHEPPAGSAHPPLAAARCIPLAGLAGLPMPSPYRKALDALLARKVFHLGD